MSAFKLGSVKLLDVVEYKILHPETWKPTTWSWQLGGPGHPDVLKREEAIFREDQVEKEARQRRALEATQSGKTPAPEYQTREGNRLSNAKARAARVIGWSPVEINDEPLEFSFDAVVKLLADPAYMWLYMQISAQLDGLQNFLPRAETPSSGSLDSVSA